MTPPTSPEAEASPGGLENALEQAVVHHRAGQLADAERLYRAILQTDPAHSDANHNLGILALQVGKPREGLPHLKSALESNPNKGEYWLSYVNALLTVGEAQAADQVLQEGRRHGLNGEPVDALATKIAAALAGSAPAPDDLDRAIAHQEAGRYKEAIPLLQALAAAQPQDAAVWATLSHNLALDGQLPAAEDAIQRANALNPQLSVVRRNHARLLLRRNQLADAQQTAQAACDQEPDHPENLVVLAAILATAQQDAQALALIERAIGLRPDYAEAFASRVFIQIRRGDHAAALADAEQALALKPHLRQLWGTVGWLKRQLNDLPGAIAALEKALELDPDNTDYLVTVGEYKRQTGASDAAVAVLTRAVTRAPGNLEAWVNLGAALQASDQAEAAKAAYAKALEINPNQPEVLNNLGALAKAERNWPEALRYFEAALALKPDHYDFLINKASALQNARRHAEAAAAAEAAIARDPTAPLPHMIRGDALHHLGLTQDSNESYLKALALDPQLSEAMLEIARNYIAQRRFSEAAQILETAKRGAPDKYVLTAPVYLAILAYLDGNLAAARQHLIDSAEINSLEDGYAQFGRIYWRYLDRLLSHHAAPQLDLTHPAGELLVVGESHALSYHGTRVRLEDRALLCKASWAPGCKQWHLANGQPNQYKRAVEAAIEAAPNASMLLMVFGEIDCRIDEGVAAAAKKRPETPIAQIIETTVDGYLSFIANAAQPGGHKVIIAGVPAPKMRKGQPLDQDQKQFIEIVRAFNDRLRAQTCSKGMSFLDLYALTDAGAGMSDGDCHIDSFHLLPSSIQRAFEAHLQLVR